MSVEVSNLDIHRDHSIAKHIECFTTYHFKDCETVQFIPEGRVELLFQFGSRFLHRTSHDKTWVLRPAGFVGGLHDSAYHVRSLDGKATCIGIKFRPGSAQYFMRGSQGILKNKVSAIEDIWGPSSRSITQSLAIYASADDVASKIQSFLRTHFIAPSKPEFEFTTKAVRGATMRSPVADLAVSLRMSTSHFRKKFSQGIGLSPSQYTKIVTISQAIRRLEAHDYQSLTELALALGYYDQAHFIRAFRSITSCSPRQYLAQVS